MYMHRRSYEQIVSSLLVLLLGKVLNLSLKASIQDMVCLLSALGFRPNRYVRSQTMVFSRLGGNFLGVVDSMKETQSMADFAKQVAKFGESVMKHERNYTWRCLDVCFDDLLAPRQAWIMWNERKAHVEVLTKHDARVDNNKLCLSLKGTKLGGKLVREVGFYYKQKLCCISGKSYTHRAKLDALNSLTGTHVVLERNSRIVFGVV